MIEKIYDLFLALLFFISGFWPSIIMVWLINRHRHRKLQNLKWFLIGLGAVQLIWWYIGYRLAVSGVFRPILIKE